MNVLTENSYIFKEVYKLLCLIVTIPSKAGEVAYLRNLMSEERLTNLSKLLIVEDLQNDLISSQPFFDDMINKFASLKDRRVDLIFKK